jgi:site-specific DNA recombinase
MIAPQPPRAAVYDRAAIYSRVSTLMQAQHGFSLAAQAKDCQRLADELGAVVVGEPYVDQDSGAEWDLPQLNAMLDAAKRREFDVLIVYDPDRLARNMAKQLVIEEELKRYGVTIQYVGLRLGDSAEDRLLKNVRASIAEYEREKIRMRTSRGRREKAERGLVVGIGQAPYGYRYVHEVDPRTKKSHVVGLEPDPTTAPVLARIFADVASMALNEVCRGLNADGIRSYFAGQTRTLKSGRVIRYSGRWTTSTLLGILRNPVYLGTAAYGRRDTYKRWRDPETWLTAAVPPLVDRPTWDAAHAALERRKVQRAARKPELEDAFPLRGLLTCGHCGGTLASTLNGSRERPGGSIRYYHCVRNQPWRARFQGQPRCELPALLAAPLEADVWQRVSQALLHPEHLQEGLAAAQEEHTAARERRQARLETIDREIERLRTRFDRITDERLDAARGSETERALKAKAAEVEATIQRLAAQRAAFAAEPMPGLSPEEQLELTAFATDLAAGVFEAEIAAGVEAASPADRRRIYQLLHLGGTVRLDPEHGLKLGRKHRFAVDWKGLIELQNGGSEYKKVRVEYYTDAYANWERDNLGEVKIALDGIPLAEPTAASV